MSKEFIVTVYFPPNQPHLSFSRSFAGRVVALSYARGAAQGQASLVTVQNMKGGLEAFVAGRNSTTVDLDGLGEITLPVICMFPSEVETEIEA